MGIIENLEIYEENFEQVKLIYSSSNTRDEKTLLLYLSELDKIRNAFKSAKSLFLDKKYIANKIKEVNKLIADIEEDVKRFTIN